MAKALLPIVAVPSLPINWTPSQPLQAHIFCTGNEVTSFRSHFAHRHISMWVGMTFIVAGLLGIASARELRDPRSYPIRCLKSCDLCINVSTTMWDDWSWPME
ncbi:hypothetical protein FRB95_010164 [Tulasnella sp. JGI-2019a]|nr:hypothetical protein FRB95_010164 [Tulasnella sp. JGI-2019a]